jgi:hypothetical protein
MGLVERIGKARDIIATRDFKKILGRVQIFDEVTNKAKIQVDRYIKDTNYELDFNHYDLQELSDEIFNYVKNFQTKMLFKQSQKELLKNKTINNEVLQKFNQKQCDVLYLDRKLREAYKILSYLAITVWLWTEAREQEELDWQVTQLIRSFL